MHPIENIMQTTMTQIKEMVDVNTIVGDAVISPDGSTIIPVSKVSFGFVAGGGEYNQTSKDQANQDQNSEKPFAGGAGAGISIQPMGFVIVNDESIRMLSFGQKNMYDKAIETISQIITDIRNMFKDKEYEQDNF
jgi:sporulation protein YtfJ